MFTVLTQLDEFKRESGNARETIRWLESQFQRGNRHLRSQKAQEKRHLGLIKYPKKKEKDKWWVKYCGETSKTYSCKYSAREERYRTHTEKCDINR